jgi:hypothetical protein
MRIALRVFYGVRQMAAAVLGSSRIGKLRVSADWAAEYGWPIFRQLDLPEFALIRLHYFFATSHSSETRIIPLYSRQAKYLAREPVPRLNSTGFTFVLAL